jgi:hypothetical protein
METQILERIILLQDDLIKMGDEMVRLRSVKGSSVREASYVALKLEYAVIREEIKELKVKHSKNT